MWTFSGLLDFLRAPQCDVSAATAHIHSTAENPTLSVWSAHVVGIVEMPAVGLAGGYDGMGWVDFGQVLPWASVDIQDGESDADGDEGEAAAGP